MFIEFNERSTGKTTRLVDSIVTFLRENVDRTALVIAPSEVERKIIVNKVEENCKICHKRVITSYKMLPMNSNKGTMKQFVDNFTDMNGRDMKIDEGAYYCGVYHRDVFSDNVHNICKDILDTYSNNHTIKPNRLITTHKLSCM